MAGGTAIHKHSSFLSISKEKKFVLNLDFIYDLSSVPQNI